MPRGDRTGPMGMGPMTGRGAGLCGGNDSPGYMSAGGGRFTGYGRNFGPGSGRGGRHGYRHCFYATGIPGFMRFGVNPSSLMDDEIRILKSQAEYLSKSLDAVTRRIGEIEAKDTAE